MNLSDDDVYGKYAFMFSGCKSAKTYEDGQGGLFTQPFLNTLFAKGCDAQAQVLLEDFWYDVTREVQAKAESAGVKQTPKLTCLFEATTNAECSWIFQCLDLVIVVCPEYEGRFVLEGAKKDVELLMSNAGRVFGRSCHFVLMMKEPAQCRLGSRQTMEVVTPTQAELFQQLSQAVEGGKNPGLFLFGHGSKQRVNGRVDEYIVFPDERSDVKGRLTGKKIAQLTESFKTNPQSQVMVVFNDLCYGYGMPGLDDFSTDVSAISRALPPETDELEHVLRQALYVGADKVTQHVMDCLRPDQVTCAASVASGSPSAPLAVYPGTPMGTPTVSHLGKEVVDRGLMEDAKNAVPNVVDAQKLEAVKKICKRIGNFLPWFWNTLEGFLQGTFGASLAAILGPVVGLSMLCLGVAGLACTMVYLGIVMRYPVRTLGPVLLSVLFTTALPYLCNPNNMQAWLPAHTAFSMGVHAFVLSMVTMTFMIIVNSDRIMQWENVNRCGKWAMGMVGHSQGLLIIAVHLHFLGQGPTIQQTMRIRTNGAASFVVFFPMKTLVNGTRVCGIPSPADKGVHLLKVETAYSMLERDVGDGQKADFTCNYDVFLMRVAERSENKGENLETLAFREGRHVVNLTYVREITGHVQRLLNIGGAVPKDDALLAQLRLATGLNNANWASVLERTLQGKERVMTWTERFAYPVLYLIGHCVRDVERLVWAHVKGV